jgi:hypothetical protein
MGPISSLCLDKPSTVSFWDNPLKTSAPNRSHAFRSHFHRQNVQTHFGVNLRRCHDSHMHEKGVRSGHESSSVLGDGSSTSVQVRGTPRIIDHWVWRNKICHEFTGCKRLCPNIFHWSMAHHSNSTLSRVIFKERQW